MLMNYFDRVESNFRIWIFYRHKLNRFIFLQISLKNYLIIHISIEGIPLIFPLMEIKIRKGKGRRIFIF